MAVMAAEAWRPAWQELPDGSWFTEGPAATEVLLEPEGGGRWRWGVSRHTGTGFERCGTGSVGDRGKAAMAAERACRRAVAEVFRG